MCQGYCFRIARRTCEATAMTWCKSLWFSRAPAAGLCRSIFALCVFSPRRCLHMLKCYIWPNENFMVEPLLSFGGNAHAPFLLFLTVPPCSSMFLHPVPPCSSPLFLPAFPCSCSARRGAARGAAVRGAARRGAARRGAARRGAARRAARRGGARRGAARRAARRGAARRGAARRGAARRWR